MGYVFEHPHFFGVKYSCVMKYQHIFIFFFFKTIQDVKHQINMDKYYSSLYYDFISQMFVLHFRQAQQINNPVIFSTSLLRDYAHILSVIQIHK